MPLQITYKCQDCLTLIEWIYEEGEDLHPTNLTGCPGKGCTRLHELWTKEIDAEETQQLKDGEPYSR